ncbi:alpha-2A adrenergic receptor-like isoform X2 [Watersipora subatra]
MLKNVSCLRHRRKEVCISFQNIYEGTERIEQINMLNFNESGWIWAGALFYSPLCMLGIIGSVITLLTFCKYIKKTTTTTCIIALAAVDLAICTITMPIAIYTFVGGNTGSNIICKLGKFAVFFTVPLSCGILLLLTLNRFLLVACLRKKILTPFRAKVCIVFLFVICLVSAILQSLSFSTQVEMDVPHCHNFVCDLHFCQPNEYYLSNQFVSGLKNSGVIACIIIAFVSTMFVLLTFLKLFQIRKQITDSKLSPTKQNAVGMMSTSVANLGHTKTTESDVDKPLEFHEGHDLGEIAAEKLLTLKYKEMKPTWSAFRVHKKCLPHFQMALTLLLMTLSFIVAHAPMTIMILFKICENTTVNEGCMRNDYRYFLWQSYFLNHALNPIIYLFNPQFIKAFRNWYSN